MKKVILFLAVASAIVSCTKSVDYYVGTTQEFEYIPTRLQVTSGIMIGTNAKITLNNRTTFYIRAITGPNMAADCFILEAPIIPGIWTWDQYSSRYKPENFKWNAGYGFSSGDGTVYCAERNGLGYTVRPVLAQWFKPPSMSSWISAYSSPRDGVNASFPIIGTITQNYNGSYSAGF